MPQRKPLQFPITLGVVLIVLVVALAVGWILLTSAGVSSERTGPLYWTLLAIGTAGFVAVLVGVSIYLGLSIKTINLTRRQSNFIDSVTHELKSPIASLKLYLQTLNRRDIDASVRHQFYSSMLDDLQRLDQLIDHILDAARLDRSTDGEINETVELSDVISSCAVGVCQRHAVPESAIRLRLLSCNVTARRVDVEIIFRNLLDNAIKYSGESPEVFVTLDFPLPEEARVQIADNGPGIPRKQRRRIFRRFERLGLELERKKPGLGLGLYLVRTLVAQLRGRVRAIDRTDGNGTIIEVRLPARQSKLSAQTINASDDVATDETERPEQVGAN